MAASGTLLLQQQCNITEEMKRDKGPSKVHLQASDSCTVQNPHGVVFFLAIMNRSDSVGDD